MKEKNVRDYTVKENVIHFLFIFLILVMNLFLYIATFSKNSKEIGESYYFFAFAISIVITLSLYFISKLFNKRKFIKLIEFFISFLFVYVISYIVVTFDVTVPYKCGYFGSYNPFNVRLSRTECLNYELLGLLINYTYLSIILICINLYVYLFKKLNLVTMQNNYHC